jgi:diacylglycerol kinase family enzyme
VERRAALKRYASHPLFVYAGFATWFRHYDRSRPRFSVHHSDGSVVDDGYLGICLNSNPYTYLGSRPFNLAPDATFERGLTMVTVRTLDFVEFLGIAASALTTGRRLRRHRHVDYRPDLTALTVRGHGPFPYQIDGDYLGETDQVVLRHEPDVLDIVPPV